MRSYKSVLFFLLTGVLALGLTLSRQEPLAGQPYQPTAAERLVLFEGRVIAPEHPPESRPQIEPEAEFPARSDSSLLAVGGTIAFQSSRTNGFDIYQQLADGSGEAEDLVISDGYLDARLIAGCRFCLYYSWQSCAINRLHCQRYGSLSARLLPDKERTIWINYANLSLLPPLFCWL
jgi:hypothetical protein